MSLLQNTFTGEKKYPWKRTGCLWAASSVFWGGWDRNEELGLVMPAPSWRSQLPTAACQGCQQAGAKITGSVSHPATPGALQTTAKRSKTKVCLLQKERPGYSCCRKWGDPGQDGRQSPKVPAGAISLCDNHPEECGREEFEKEGSEKWLTKVWTCKSYVFFLVSWHANNADLSSPLCRKSEHHGV